MATATDQTLERACTLCILGESPCQQPSSHGTGCALPRQVKASSVEKTPYCAGGTPPMATGPALHRGAGEAADVSAEQGAWSIDSLQTPPSRIPTHALGWSMYRSELLQDT